MRILLATDWFLPTLNGVVISVLNLRRQLEERGHEVIILTLSQTNESHKKDGVWSVAAYSAGKFYPEARFSWKSGDPIIDELIDWKPDVIHTQCEMSTFRFAKKIAKVTCAPIVHTYHTVYEHYVHYLRMGARTGKKFVEVFSRKMLRATDHVIVPTIKTRRILEGYRVKPPMHIIPTGIDLERFEEEPKPEQMAELRARYGIGDHELVLLTAGRLAKEKNTEELIEAVYQLYGGSAVNLPERTSNIALVVVGGGPYGDVLKAKAAECERIYGAKHCRVIFTGEIQQPEMPLHYRLGHCFVSASISETQGLTYIEALACGLPAICRKDECLEGLIEEGVNGYTFVDRAGLNRALKLVLERPQNYQTMCEEAQKSAERYTMEQFCENVEQVYIRAIQDRF